MAVVDSGLGVYILLVILLSVYLRTGLAQPGTRTRCTDISRPNDTAEIVLTCNDSFSWFHVVEEHYSENSTDGCNTLGLNALNRLKTNSDSGLAVDCIGKQKHHQQNKEIQCIEKVSRVWFTNDLNQQFVSVKYECVKDDLNFNMCDDVSVERPGAVYLASPDFFDQDVSSDICQCRVMTTGLQLQALYVSIDNDNSLNMTCDQCHHYSFTWKPITVINILVIKGNDSVNILDISFRDTALPLYGRNRVWLKVNGTQNVSVLCNKNIIPTEPPLTPGSTTKTSDTTTSSSPTATTGTSTASSTKHTSTSSTTSASKTTSDTTTSSPTRPTTETSTVTSAENTVSGPATSTSVQDTVTDRSQEVAFFIGGFLSGAVCVLAAGFGVFLYRRHRKRQSKDPGIAPDLPLHTVPSPTPPSSPTEVAGVHELSPAEAQTDVDVGGEIGYLSIYSSLAPLEERDTRGDRDNYTSLPQRYTNVSPPSRQPADGEDSAYFNLD